MRRYWWTATQNLRRFSRRWRFWVKTLSLTAAHHSTLLVRSLKSIDTKITAPSSKAEPMPIVDGRSHRSAEASGLHPAPDRKPQAVPTPKRWHPGGGKACNPFRVGAGAGDRYPSGVARRYFQGQDLAKQ